MRRLFVLAILLFVLPAHAVTIDWVAVGDAGNACDTQSQGCFGSVPYTYWMAEHEVTNAQYAEFLNAVADADPTALYDTSMGNTGYGSNGGITRSGNSGSYTYSTIAGRESMPVNNVSFWDAVRFANWLHNGQPAGAQGSATTEDGAYTLLGGTPVPSNWAVTRNAGARIVLPSEDEWYKAAYYDALSMSYFDYPAGTDTTTVCATPGASPNTANCGWPSPAVNDLTDVGSYTGSASPYGTFDQGGNVYEWNDTLFGTSRGIRGGIFNDYAFTLAASWQNAHSGEAYTVGFRVATTIPEPSTALLLGFGLAGLAASGRRRSLR